MPTMMLLIGMNMSFTKKPMNPMIAKPTDVACAIFENSASRDETSRVGASRRVVHALATKWRGSQPPTTPQHWCVCVRVCVCSMTGLWLP